MRDRLKAYLNSYSWTDQARAIQAKKIGKELSDTLYHIRECLNHNFEVSINHFPELVEKIPNNPIILFAAAIGARTLVEQNKFLSQIRFGRFAPDAAWQLAQNYHELKKPIQRQAWLAQAILCKSPEACDAFLKNYRILTNPYFGFDTKGIPLKQEQTEWPLDFSWNKIELGNALACNTLILILLHGVKLETLEKSDWLKQWNFEDQINIEKAAMPNLNLSSVFDETHSFHLLIKNSFQKKPFLFLKFFNYCFNEKIINNLHYKALLEMTYKFCDQRDGVKELITRLRFKYHLGRQELDEARQFFALILYHGFSLRVDDLTGLDDNIQDELSYELSLNLAEHKYKADAINFLSHVKNPRIFDERLFNFASLLDLKGEEFHVSQFYIEALKLIIKEEKHPLRTKALSEIDEHEDKAIYQKFLAIIATYETYLDDRNHRYPNKDKEREAIMQQFNTLASHDGLKSVKACKQQKDELYKQFHALFKRCEKLTGHHQTKQMINEMRDHFIFIDERDKLLEQISESKKELPSQNSLGLNSDEEFALAIQLSLQEENLSEQKPDWQQVSNTPTTIAIPLGYESQYDFPSQFTMLPQPPAEPMPPPPYPESTSPPSYSEATQTNLLNVPISIDFKPQSLIPVRAKPVEKPEASKKAIDESYLSLGKQATFTTEDYSALMQSVRENNLSMQAESTVLSSTGRLHEVFKTLQTKTSEEQFHDMVKHILVDTNTAVDQQENKIVVPSAQQEMQEPKQEVTPPKVSLQTPVTLYANGVKSKPTEKLSQSERAKDKEKKMGRQEKSQRMAIPG